MTQAHKFDELPADTKEFLTDLSKDDIDTLKKGLPIIRAIAGFGKVTKWLAIAAIGVLTGTVLLAETIAKIIGWFRNAAGS